MSGQIEVRYAVTVGAEVYGEADNPEDAWTQAHEWAEENGEELSGEAQCREYQTDEWVYDKARGTLVRVDL